MPSIDSHRRLAAVLAADIVGYSRLMGEDESGTLAAENGCSRMSLRRVDIEAVGKVLEGRPHLL